MGGTSVVSIGKANLGDAPECTRQRRARPLFLELMRTARSLWQRKTVPNLRCATGHKERSIKYWLAGESEFDAAALAGLLHSDHGFEFLVTVMSQAEDPPEWWQWFGEMMELIRLRTVQLSLDQRLQQVRASREARVRRRLGGALDACAASSAELAATEQALSRIDPDFFGAHASMERRFYEQAPTRDCLPAGAVAQAATSGRRR